MRNLEREVSEERHKKVRNIPENEGVRSRPEENGAVVK